MQFLGHNSPNPDRISLKSIAIHNIWFDIRKVVVPNRWRKTNKNSTYCKSCMRFLMVDKSIGDLIIFLYVGNCFVLTGNKNGHESSCNWCSQEIYFIIKVKIKIVHTSIASNIVLHAANSLINFLVAWRSFFSNFNFSLASFSNAAVWLSSSIAAAAVVIGWTFCRGGVDGGSDAGLCIDATVCDVFGGLDCCILSETSSAIGISSSTLSMDVVAEMIGAICAGVDDGFKSTDVECSSKDVEATEWVGLK